jgi:cobalt-zinc-cadmium efflux system membrane fusion protein
MHKILPLAFFLLACGPGGPATEADDDHAGEEPAAAADDGHDHAQADPAAGQAENEGGLSESESPEAESGDPEAEAEEESLHVEPENVEAWGIEVGRPDHTHVLGELQLPGVLTTNDNRTSRIGSLVEGQIADLKVDLGTQVRAGQTLATLNAPEFTRAQTEFLRAFAQAKLSQQDYERAILLRDENAIEEREFLRRESLVEQHMAELRSAEVILHAFGMEEDQLRAMSNSVTAEAPLEDHTAVQALLPIRTPIGGVVIQRDAVLGDHTDPERTLFTVSDLSVLWARLDAYENQIPLLTREAEVVIRTSLYPDRTFPGEVTVVADQVDPELRTIRVRAEVPNPDGLLRPNMYVQGFLKVTSPDEEHFILPVDAVQIHEGHHMVFIKLPPEPGEDHLVFEVRDVEIGETLTDGIIILSGLDGSEDVVRVGAFTLKAEMTKGAGGHNHVH